MQYFEGKDTLGGFPGVFSQFIDWTLRALSHLFLYDIFICSTYSGQSKAYLSASYGYLNASIRTSVFRILLHPDAGRVNAVRRLRDRAPAIVKG